MFLPCNTEVLSPVHDPAAAELYVEPVHLSVDDILRNTSGNIIPRTVHNAMLLCKTMKRVLLFFNYEIHVHKDAIAIPLLVYNISTTGKNLTRRKIQRQSEWKLCETQDIKCAQLSTALLYCSV